MTTNQLLSGLRVLEIADERGEFVWMTLAGLGAGVIKLEPPQGSSSRRLPPFSKHDPAESLFFWHFNRGKRSVAVDSDNPRDLDLIRQLVERTDIVLLNEVSWFPFSVEELRSINPDAVVAVLYDFGPDGPWKDYVATDLVHLALGGQTKQCGYDPLPDGTYDTPPIAPQFWHSYQMAGEQLLMGILGADYHRRRDGGGQLVECSVHEAAAKNIELDVNSWIYLRTPLYRQTARHANKRVGHTLTIVHTKDGRWYTLAFVGEPDLRAIKTLFEKYGMGALFPDRPATPQSSKAAGQGRAVPGSSGSSSVTDDVMMALQRFFRRFTYETAPWQFAQQAGIMCAPIRQPHENLADEHWWSRRTFTKTAHETTGGEVDFVNGKWLSNETRWELSGRAPALGADRQTVEAFGEFQAARMPQVEREATLAGVLVVELTAHIGVADAFERLGRRFSGCATAHWCHHGNPGIRIA